MRKRDACPGSEILKKKFITRELLRTGHGNILGPGKPTLPFSSLAAGAVPAYKEVIGPYVRGYVISRPKIFIATPESPPRSVAKFPGCREMDTMPSPPYLRASSFEKRMLPCNATDYKQRPMSGERRRRAFFSLLPACSDRIASIRRFSSPMRESRLQA